MSVLPKVEGKRAYEANLSILSEEEKKIGNNLCALDQSHLFAHWPLPGTDDANKHRFLQQAALLDHEYLGGAKAYIERAKTLLAAAKEGANPYEGYRVSEPKESVCLETAADFNKYEPIGLQEVGNAAFVIVAGGLGERLGYKGIKLALPSEITTETTYIELYIRHILAFQTQAQSLSRNTKLKIPLGIMTSDDTDKLTRQLLQEHKNFGMDEDQLIIFKQGKVPSLLDNDANFCLEENDPYALDTKPHGHGDVHMLLYQHHIVENWVQKQHKKWIVFFQDTNGLVFRAIPGALGVSADLKLAVNSIVVPRAQGDAVGAICTLERDGEAKSAAAAELPARLTINVEYNQLEGLLGKGVKEKTVNGASVYPGNINVLIFDAVQYLDVLNTKKGVISEFVNPKYKPNTDNNIFKKPTRLECMMQDYPKLLDAKALVGFAQFQRWTSFSAVKNAIADGVDKQKSGNAAEVAATGEADIYAWSHRVLSEAGVSIAAPTKHTYKGIVVDEDAKIVLYPSVGVTQQQIHNKFMGKDKIKISAKSTLVVDGQDIVFKSLNLDGTLLIRAIPGAFVEIDNLTIHNAGWSFTEITDEKAVDQKYAVRGYTLSQKETASFVFDTTGTFVLSDATKEQYKSTKPAITH